MKMKELATVNESLPTPSTGNPFLDVAAEGGSAFGKIIKFNKGRWLCGDDEIPAGSEYICHIGSAMRGWVKFIDGKIVERRIGKIADGFKFAPREQLGDNKPVAWPEKDEKGAPRDPWAKQYFVPLVSIDGGQVFTFITGSKGGEIAIRSLCLVYGHRFDSNLPIIALKSSPFKHKVYGRVEAPDLAVVGWDGGHTPSAPHDIRDDDGFPSEAP